MKATKKLLVTLAVMALCMMPMAGVLADETTTTINQNSTTPSTQTTLTVDVPATYTVTIPTTISVTNLTKNTAANVEIGGFDVKLSNCFLAMGKTMNISVVGTNNAGFQLKDKDSEQTLQYGIYVGDSLTAVEPSEDIATINATSGGAEDQTVSCKIKLNESPTYAGSYSDTLTFKVE